MSLLCASTSFHLANGTSTLSVQEVHDGSNSLESKLRYGRQCTELLTLLPGLGPASHATGKTVFKLDQGPSKLSDATYQTSTNADPERGSKTSREGQLGYRCATHPRAKQPGGKNKDDTASLCAQDLHRSMCLSTAGRPTLWTPVNHP
jgi:hypothetical protein